MRYPEFIKSGDTIGYVAPSFGCNMEPYKSAFDNALLKFSNLGYKNNLGPNCYKGDGVGISTNPIDCAKELTEYYISDNNDALISCGGGELMCETMSYVDFEAIKNANPKWFMGFSDNTNFTFLLTTICDTAAIYGPCAAKFGMEPWHESVSDALKLLEGSQLTMHSYDKWELESLKSEENPLAPLNLTEDTVMRGYVPSNKAEDGNPEIYSDKTESSNSNNVESSSSMIPSEDVAVKGRLIGGCVDCLVNLIGTKFDKVESFLEKYKEDGFIWYLECCDLNTFSMRRAMWQMYEAGWFKYCKGFLIGRPMHFDEPMFGLDRFGAVLPTIEKVGVPAVMDIDIGHLSPMMPLINGSIAQIVYGHDKLTVEMSLK